MAQRFPYERASSVLAEAEIFGDIPTAARWKISRRTIINYRNRTTEDGELLQSFILKKRMLLASWNDDVVKSVRTSLKTIEELIPGAQKAIEDPERAKSYAAVLHAVAGALKILGELHLAHEALHEPKDP